MIEVMLSISSKNKFIYAKDTRFTNYIKAYQDYITAQDCLRVL